jgi:hypothetical protein
MPSSPVAPQARISVRTGRTFAAKRLRLARLRPAPEREFAAYPLWTFTQPKL